MDKIDFSKDKLRDRRIELGLSQNQVVARLWEMGHKAASRQLLKNYELGKNVPGIEYALSLSSIYHCSVYDLVDNKKEDK